MKKISFLLVFFFLLSLPVMAKDLEEKKEKSDLIQKKLDESLDKKVDAQQNKLPEEISIEEAKKLWDKKEYILIDVREDSEFAEVSIPEVKLINLGKLEKNIPQLEKDKNYLTICRSGKRSLKAAKMMRKKGLNATSIKGGMLEWEAKGYPVKK